MKQHPQNSWFQASEFPALARLIHKAATEEHMRYLNNKMHQCKYLEVRIDMRTGDFILMDQHGATLVREEVQQLFPELFPSP
jgi:hypothetical protein